MFGRYQKTFGINQGWSTASAQLSASQEGPTNLVLPSIIGFPIENSLLTFDVGVWDTAIAFEIELINAVTGEVLLPKQSPSSNTTGTVPVVRENILILKVWGIDSTGNKTLSSSQIFGPILPAQWTWVRGITLNTDLVYELQSLAYPWINLPENVADAVYSSILGYGWFGSSVAELSGNIISITSDPRLRRRWSGNNTPASRSLRIDVPQPGIYRVWAAAGSTGIGNFILRDGPSLSDESNIRASISRTTGAGQFVDASNTLHSVNTWRTAYNDTVQAGIPIDIRIDNGCLLVHRNTTAPRLCCIALALVSP